MKKTPREKPDFAKLADEFEQLLDSDPAEEAVHQFINNPLLLGNLRRVDGPRIDGVLSKFPLTPDRIPDFIGLSLSLRRSQFPSRLHLMELKRPTSQLYVQHGRMSKDLNDAWMESVESIRLLGMNYPDVLRRLVKEISSSELDDFDKWEAEAKELGRERDRDEHRLYDHAPPYCSCLIIVGRRSSLDSEALFRTRQLSASTGHTINVATYDYFLDRLRSAAERSFFSSGFFW